MVIQFNCWAVGDKMCWYQVILLTLNLALYRELEEGRSLIKIAVLPGEALHTAKVLLDWALQLQIIDFLKQ